MKPVSISIQNLYLLIGVLRRTQEYLHGGHCYGGGNRTVPLGNSRPSAGCCKNPKPGRRERYIMIWTNSDYIHEKSQGHNALRVLTRGPIENYLSFFIEMDQLNTCLHIDFNI